MERGRTATGMGGHQSPNKGETDTWLTPPDMLRALGEFDLDPCCPPNMPWRTAKTMLTREDDGLLANWHGRVWLNPPYGPETAWWLKKLSDHGRGIALIFARTETDAWHRWVWPKASGVLFLRGQIHFHRIDGTRAPHNSGAPSALVAYGLSDSLQLGNAGLAGRIVHL